MKRLLIILIVLAAILGGAYFWWQQNAARIITEEVRKQAAAFCLNPEALEIENDPVQMRGLREARVPKLVISGNNLKLRSGITIASAKLVFTNIDIAGPPFAMRDIGGGYFHVSATDDAVTEYLHTRGIRLMLGSIPLDTVTVAFVPGGANVTTTVTVPVINKAVPITARGQLVPASKNGQVDFRIKEPLKIKGWDFGAKQLTDALDHINPVIDVSEWPVESDIKIDTRKGSVLLRGTITGVRSRSLLPLP